MMEIGPRSTARMLLSRHHRGALVLAIIMVMTFSMPASAYAADAIIEVSNAGDVKPGEEFDVSVSIVGNPGFAALAMEFSFDTNALEFVGFGADGLIRSGLIENIDDAAVGYFSGTNLTGDGILFSARFKLKDDAAAGNYPIEIGLRNDTPANLVNAEAQPVSVAFAAGGVSVGGSTSTGGNNTSSTSGTSSLPSEPTSVTAYAQDGSALEFLLRNGTNGLEYSLDNGVTWLAVANDGIIHTPAGMSISLDGSEDTDYSIAELPIALASGGSFDLGNIPWQLIVGIALALLVVGVSVILGRRHQRNLRIAAELKDVFLKDATVIDDPSSEAGTDPRTTVRKPRHAREKSAIVANGGV